MIVLINPLSIKMGNAHRNTRVPSVMTCPLPSFPAIFKIQPFLEEEPDTVWTQLILAIIYQARWNLRMTTCVEVNAWTDENGTAVNLYGRNNINHWNTETSCRWYSKRLACDSVCFGAVMEFLSSVTRSCQMRYFKFILMNSWYESRW